MIHRIFQIFIISSFFYGCVKVNNDCNQLNYANAPEKNWFSSFNGSEDESHGHFILNCSDGGFLQIGETGFIPNSSKIFIVKTDINGELLWKKEIFEDGYNLGNSAIETFDGYLIVGSLNRNSAIIKLEKNSGNVVFQKSSDNGGIDAFEHLALISNRIIAVGYINALENNNTFFTNGEGHLTFLDLMGNKLSSINISSYLSQGYRIKNINNELIIAGLTENAEDFGIIKINLKGDIIWNKSFGGNNLDHCFGMDVDSLGNIYLTGHTLSGTKNWDTYTMKIDNNGNQIWERKIGNPRGFDPKFIHDEAWGIKSTSDGGCVIVAGTGDEYKRYKRRCGNDGDNSNTWHVYLIKFTENGIIEWEKTFGGPTNKDWAGEDIDLIDDGSAIIAVDDGSFGFLKIDSFQ